MKIVELLAEAARHDASPEFRAALAVYAKKLYDAMMKPNKSASRKIDVLKQDGRSMSVQEMDVSVKSAKFFHYLGISPSNAGVGDFLSGDAYNRSTDSPTATQKHFTVLYTLSNDAQVYLAGSVDGVDGKTQFNVDISSFVLSSGKKIGDIPIGGIYLSAPLTRKLSKKLAAEAFKNAAEVALEGYELLQEKLITKAGL